MTSDMGSVAFIMGAVGMGAGLIALFMSIEIGRRNTEFLRRHEEEVHGTLKKNLSDYEARVAANVGSLSEKLAETEQSLAACKTEIIEVSAQVETRISNAETRLAEATTSLTKDVAAVDRKATRDSKAIAALQTAMKNAGSANANPPTGGNGSQAPLKTSAPASPNVQTRKLAASTVVTDVSGDDG